MEIDNSTTSSATRRTGTRWLAAVTAAVVAWGGFAVAPAAHAADGSATDATELATLIGTDADVELTIEMGADFDEVAAIALPESSTITLDSAGFDVTLTGEDGAAGIEVPASSTLVLIDSVGDGSFTFVGGDGAAGIGSSIDDDGFGTEVGTLRIESGVVTAKGSYAAAGIGGSWGVNGGTVEILEGQLTATGGVNAAGIGGGQYGDGGTVTITGGVLKASSEFGGAGIGGGASAVSGGTLSVLGGAAAGTSFNGGASTADEAGPAAKLISVVDETRSFRAIATAGPGGSVTIESGSFVTFDPNGGLEDVTAVFAVPGRTIDAPVEPTRDGWVFDGWFDAADGGTQWNFADPVLGNMTLFARWISPWTALQQAIAGAEDGATVTLPGDVTGDEAAGLELGAARTVTLDLDGHSLTIDASDGSVAGIKVPATSTLVVTDSSAARNGHLTVTGGTYAAGIGGAASEDSGAVRFVAGTFSVQGGANAPAIGAGRGATTAGLVTVVGVGLGDLPTTTGASNAIGAGAAAHLTEDASAPRAYKATETRGAGGKFDVVIGAEVTFNSNLSGGAGTAVPSPVFIADGTSLKDLPVPTRPDFGFGGWRVGSQSGPVWDMSAPVVDTMTLIARWNTAWVTLMDAFQGAESGSVTELSLQVDTEGLSGEGLDVPAGADIRLDLAGFDLVVDASSSSGVGARAAIRLPEGARLTILDSVGGGTVIAKGGVGAAGIGGGVGEAAGELSIEGGIITATGGAGAAAIGGGYSEGGENAAGGTVTVNALAMPDAATTAGSSTAVGGGLGAAISGAAESTKAFQAVATEDEAGAVTISTGAQVVFDSAGGSAVPSPVFVADQATLPAPTEFPTRDNYVFDTWYYSSGEWAFGEVVPANITLTAGWLQFFTAPSPIIVGDTIVGETLSVDQGTWTPEPPRVDYQWLRDGVAIAGATSATYTTSADDLGARISVRLRGWGADFIDLTITSAKSEPVLYRLETTPAPYITGKAALDHELTAQTGAWLPEATELAYQWFCDAEPISGATGATLMLTTDMVGCPVYAEVTGSLEGYRSVTMASSSLVVAAAAFDEVPLAVGFDTPHVGFPVSVETGTWSPAATFTYQWLRDGAAIEGATGATYTPVVGDLGRELSVIVTGSADNVASESVGSVRVKVLEGEFIAPEEITVKDATIGQTASVELGEWMPSPAFAYQWLLDGEPISGATAPTYEIPGAAGGHQLSVRVTAMFPGVNELVKTSPEVRVGLLAFDEVPPQPVIPDTARVTVPISMPALTWSPVPDSLLIEWLVDGEVAATTSSYMPTLEDAGKELVYRATAKKDGYDDSVVTSEPVTIAARGFDRRPTSVEVEGVFKYGETVTVIASATDWEPTPTSLAYQWFRDGVAIGGATEAAYTIAAADAGRTVHAEVSGVLTGYSSPAATTAAVTIEAGEFVSFPQPTIDGDAGVGEELTAVVGEWEPTPESFRYVWFADNVAIEGAESATFTPTEAELGKLIKVSVTAVLGGFTEKTVTSEESEAVQAGWDVKPTTVVVSPQGETQKVGATLVAETPTWEPTPEQITYQWLRDGVVIDGASTASYTTTATDLGAKLTVKVRAGAASRSWSSVLSAPITIEASEFSTIGEPSISKGEEDFNPVAGGILTALTGTWEPTPSSFTYQWLRGGEPIEGATAATYIPTADDKSQQLSVTVTPVLAGYSAEPITTPAELIRDAFTKKGTAKVAATTYAVGQKLTVTYSGWSPTPGTYLIEWVTEDKDRVKTVVGKGASYTPTAADQGKTLYPKVTAQRENFADSWVKGTARTVLKAFAKAPVPTVKGTMAVGQKLTASAGTWSPKATFKYQWLRNGVAIKGATKSTYTLAAADGAKTITVQVTGSAAGYGATSKVSVSKVKVWAKASKPTVSGTFKVGKTLTAKPGTWSPKATFKYQWLRNGVAIKGATKATYKLAAADAGKKISVKVTGSASGYTAMTFTSAAKAAAK